MYLYQWYFPVVPRGLYNFHWEKSVRTRFFSDPCSCNTGKFGSKKTHILSDVTQSLQSVINTLDLYILNSKRYKLHTWFITRRKSLFFCFFDQVTQCKWKLRSGEWMILSKKGHSRNGSVKQRMRKIHRLYQLRGNLFVRKEFWEKAKKMWCWWMRIRMRNEIRK